MIGVARPSNDIRAYQLANHLGCDLILRPAHFQECKKLIRGHAAAEQRDELAPFQLIELHSVPCQQASEEARRDWEQSKAR